MNTINAYIREMQQVLAGMDENAIGQNVRLLFDAWKRRRQVFTLGNGGSAATASHMANDLSKGTIVANLPRMKRRTIKKRVDQKIIPIPGVTKSIVY